MNSGEFWYFLYCKKCLRPSEDRQGLYEGIPVQYVCECGVTDYTYIRIESEEEYDKLEIDYWKRYKREKKLERILNE